MGMFDNLSCEYPIDVPPGMVFQTKDTDAQYLEHYKIDIEGYLWFNETVWEFKLNEGKEGLAALVGSVKTVSSEWKRQENFRGEIRFYNSDAQGGWWEFSALFDDGKLLNMKTISNGQPGAVW